MEVDGWQISVYKQIPHPDFLRWRAVAELRVGDKKIYRIHREGRTADEAIEVVRKALEDHPWRFIGRKT